MNTRNLAVGFLLAAALVPATSYAGTGGAEFADIYAMLTGWITGTLGKVLALSFFAIGIAMGVVRQSLMASVTSIACALAIFFAPVVIDGIITAELTPELVAAALPPAQL